jgi:hypothetical protein
LAEFAEIRQIWLGLKFAIRLISAEFNEKSTEFGPNIRIHSGPIFLSAKFLNAGLVCIYMRDLLMYLLLCKVKKTKVFLVCLAKVLWESCVTPCSARINHLHWEWLSPIHMTPPPPTPPPLLVAVVAYHFWWSSVAISYCVQGSSHVPSYLNHLRWWVAPRYPYPPLSLTTHH